jgi:hypothetical protein
MNTDHSPASFASPSPFWSSVRMTMSAEKSLVYCQPLRSNAIEHGLCNAIDPAIAASNVTAKPFGSLTLPSCVRSIKRTSCVVSESHTAMSYVDS